MKFGIVTFPGSNCDDDAYHAVVDALGAEAVYLWHKSHDLEGADVVILPGGFSYGDYLRAGAIARFSPIMREVVAHARARRAGAGDLQRLPDRLRGGSAARRAAPERSLQFVCEPVHLRVENTGHALHAPLRRRRDPPDPLAHGEGRYTADAATLARLEDDGHVIFRYVDEHGEPTAAANPNGSARNIAGIVNAAATCSA